jgi:hypothetical protein
MQHFLKSSVIIHSCLIFNNPTDFCALETSFNFFLSKLNSNLKILSSEMDPVEIRLIQ